MHSCVFFCPPERAEMLKTAVQMVNSAAPDTEPMAEVRAAPVGDLELVWVTLGCVAAGSGQPAHVGQILGPIRDTMHYLESRPGPPDDLRLGDPPGVGCA